MSSRPGPATSERHTDVQAGSTFEHRPPSLGLATHVHGHKLSLCGCAVLCRVHCSQEDLSCTLFSWRLLVHGRCCPPSSNGSRSRHGRPGTASSRRWRGWVGDMSIPQMSQRPLRSRPSTSPVDIACFAWLVLSCEFASYPALWWGHGHARLRKQLSPAISSRLQLLLSQAWPFAHLHDIDDPSLNSNIPLTTKPPARYR